MSIVFVKKRKKFEKLATHLEVMSGDFHMQGKLAEENHMMWL